MLVLSSIRFSGGASVGAFNFSKALFQTPLFVQRFMRMEILFHLPQGAGKPRHLHPFSGMERMARSI